MTEAHVTRIDGIHNLSTGGVAHILVHDNTDSVEFLHAFGDLDLSNAQELEAKLFGLAHRAHKPIVVMDMSACNYLDSTILTVFVRVARELKERFAVVVPAENAIRRIFQISGLDEHLGIDDSLFDASKRLKFALPHLY